MKTFQDLELIEPIKQALKEEQYHQPTPIQEQTIPPALAGEDVLGCAQTGTGKTAAFSIPILNHLGTQNRKPTPHKPNALILVPTRELAVQIGESLSNYGRHLRVRHALVYGGVSSQKQIQALSRGVHILVATPGRLLDLMNQGKIDLSALEIFSLDEADRMMDMGFLPDLKRIISQLPARRQSLFFSATLAPNIQGLAGELLRNPVHINVTPKQKSVTKIEQSVLFVDRNRKEALLQELLIAEGVGRSLVFTRTKRAANFLSKSLVRGGLKATAIHGNKSQSARQKALSDFRKDKVQILVATDVAARGIDVDDITHVFNFDMPNEPESYVHRIGRTGRAGAAGVAISFCSQEERGDLKAIERLLGQAVPVSPDFPFPASRPDRRKANSKRRRPAKKAAQGHRSRPKPAAAMEGSEGSKRPASRRRRPKRNQRRRTAATQKTQAGN